MIWSGRRVRRIWLPLLAAIAVVVDLTYALSPGTEVRNADYAQGYFGDLIPELSDVQRTKALHGYDLFVKSWREGDGLLRNADSCLSCHNVPMPGGSGMSNQSLVRIDVRKSPGTREEINQSGFPNHRKVSLPDSSIEVRRTPSLFGVGYLLFSDHRQSQGKSISHGVLGTFGMVRDLRIFVANAFATEIGVSSTIRCARRNGERGYPSRCPTSISDEDLTDVVEYLESLAAPPHHPLPKEFNGAKLFNSIGCSSCHVPVSFTRSDAPEPLRLRAFEAYTDLSLHDMGGRAPVLTAPLWGLNSSGPPYMHDACGTSIIRAVQCHGGEGKLSAATFMGLSIRDKEDIVAYLRSL